MNSCTDIACYLADKGAITFPLVTLAGIIDGINPCAISLLVFLLGYLVVFLNQRRRIFLTALVYIATVYLTYLVLGLFLYKFALLFHLSAYRVIFQKILGILFFVFSILTLKDLFWPNKGPNLRIPLNLQSRLKQLAKSANYPATIVFAVLVTLFETPCSLPLYAGTAQILSSSGLPIYAVLGYFLYYNLLFILPLIIVAAVFVKGVDFLTIEDMTHRAQRKMKLLVGLTLLGFGLYFLLT